MEKLVPKPGEVNYKLKSGDMKSQGHTQTKLGWMEGKIILLPEDGDRNLNRLQSECPDIEQITLRKEWVWIHFMMTP